jgi:hypothetical protein
MPCIRPRFLLPAPSHLSVMAALLLASVLGAALSTLVGCHACDLEDSCLINNDTLISKELHTRCDIDPQPDWEAGYVKWESKDGLCECDISVEGWQHFLRNCEFSE